MYCHNETYLNIDLFILQNLAIKMLRYTYVLRYLGQASVKKMRLLATAAHLIAHVEQSYLGVAVGRSPSTPCVIDDALSLSGDAASELYTTRNVSINCDSVAESTS